MKISTKGRYALEALTDLVMHTDAGFMNVSAIASRRGLSSNYLEQLFRTLRNAGLLESARGPTGGYRLSKNPDEISVLDVLTAMEGDVFEINCHDDPFYSCPFEGKCAAHLVWDSIRSEIVSVTGGVSLMDIARQSKKVDADEAYDYCI